MLKLQQHQEHQNKRVAERGGERSSYEHRMFLLCHSQMWLNSKQRKGLGVKSCDVFLIIIFFPAIRNLSISLAPAVLEIRH